MRVLFFFSRFSLSAILQNVFSLQKMFGLELLLKALTNVAHNEPAGQQRVTSLVLYELGTLGSSIDQLLQMEPIIPSDSPVRCRVYQQECKEEGRQVFIPSLDSRVCWLCWTFFKYISMTFGYNVFECRGAVIHVCFPPFILICCLFCSTQIVWANDLSSVSNCYFLRFTYQFVRRSCWSLCGWRMGAAWDGWFHCSL